MSLPTRNDGRKGHLGIAPQVNPSAYVAPTNYLRQTGGTGALPDHLDRQSQAFRGTSFESPAEYAGTDYMSRSTTGEATIADTKLMLQLLFGTPDAQGVITPQDATQFDANYPLQPFSGQWRVPRGGYTQFRDAQLYELTLTVPEARTEFVTAAASFHAAWAKWWPENVAPGDFTPAVPVIPSYSGGLGRLDHKVKFNGVEYAPDGASSARFFNPVEALPAVGEYVSGFAPGTDPIGVEFQMNFNSPIPDLLLAARDKTVLPYVWTLARNGGLIEVTAQVQVSAREVPVAPGRVRTSATFRARATTPGVSPFTIKTA